MKSKNLSVRLDKVSESTIDTIQSIIINETRSSIINDALHLYNLVLMTDNPLKEQLKAERRYPYYFIFECYEKKYKNQ